MNELSHIKNNRPDMVDISDKNISHRIAKAVGLITLQKSTISIISNNKIKKGNVLVTAEIAGINAAKKTSDLIPLCHNISLTKISLKTELCDNSVMITSEVKSIGKTGVEMEALLAVNVALLTVYDMCKAVDKNMEIKFVKLIHKYKKEISNKYD